jgi:autophagy-related protein 101
LSAIIHTIFFHRYFIPVTPKTRDLLDTTLPAVDDVALDTLIDERATMLARALESNPQSNPQNMRPSTHAHTVSTLYGRSGGTGGGNGTGVNGQSGRAQIVVQFLEKKRRKTYFSFGKDEEICWEQWTLDVTTATPRTDTGMYANDKMACSP